MLPSASQRGDVGPSPVSGEHALQVSLLSPLQIPAKDHCPQGWGNWQPLQQDGRGAQVLSQWVLQPCCSPSRRATLSSSLGAYLEYFKETKARGNNLSRARACSSCPELLPCEMCGPAVLVGNICTGTITACTPLQAVVWLLSPASR